MKITAAPFMVQMNKTELERLLTPVEERLATDVQFLQTIPQQKRFSHIDLWKVQRTARYRGVSIR